MTSMVTFNQEDILRALIRLGELASNAHHSVELLITGGALMVLAYQSRLATKDVDALILSPQAVLVRKWIQQVAREQELPEDWLNDAVKPFLVTISPGPVVFQATGLTVKSPLPEQMLAMKLAAWRDEGDILDAARILQELDSSLSQAEVWALCVPYLPKGTELKAQYALEDLWSVYRDNPVKSGGGQE
ncbi:MAG: hypothetical protein BWK79_08035 [Beggiatoa sp. IS2]|nr:MAG: hypothetical protein BWK79_08035 [Beggiatoa sp. IS2]